MDKYSVIEYSELPNLQFKEGSHIILYHIRQLLKLLKIESFSYFIIKKQDNNHNILAVHIFHKKPICVKENFFNLSFDGYDVDCHEKVNITIPSLRKQGYDVDCHEEVNIYIPSLRNFKDYFDANLYMTNLSDLKEIFHKRFFIVEDKSFSEKRLDLIKMIDNKYTIEDNYTVGNKNSDLKRPIRELIDDDKELDYENRASFKRKKESKTMVRINEQENNQVEINLENVKLKKELEECKQIIRKLSEQTAELICKNKLLEDEISVLGPRDSNYQKGHQFETTISKILTDNGIRINTIRLRRGDGGFDIIATFESRIILIQCKNWESPIGVRDLRDFEASIDPFIGNNILSIMVYNSKKLNHPLTKEAKVWNQTSRFDIKFTNEREIVNCIKNVNQDNQYGIKKYLVSRVAQ
ncbi:29291_t:CDS:1 [Racocetra persica]|uniref:29291_t:CDS:1 n=1 Tax=Racocetra persica TaxID=160502 RepID=A0ACA9PQV0_9GLOM|nr:29291_t:CDS:1 [Racocetra persica]